MRMLGVSALTLAAAWGMPAEAQKARNGDVDGYGAEQSADGSVMWISAKAGLPITKRANIGVGRSMMLQFEMELRDVIVSDPERVDAVVQTSDRVFLIGKKAGETNLFFFDSQGNQVMTLSITIGSDLSALQDMFNRFLPGSNIKAELAGTSIVLTGTVRTPVDAQRASDIATQFAAANKNLVSGFQAVTQTVGNVSTTQFTRQGSDPSATASKPVINMLAIEGEDQVMLKVVVAEVQRSILKQFGVNVGATIGSGNIATALLTGNSLPLTSTTLGSLGSVGITNPNGSVNYANGCFVQQPSVGGSALGNSGAFGHLNFGGHCAAYTMRALERAGLVRTLAEPNLTAVSGETAKFLAGGEYPVPVSADNGTVGISFKEFGVGVAFTPTVLSEGRISLKIDTEVSELSNEGAIVTSGIQIPSLRKRQARSTVELPSGGSMALAGLISESSRQSMEGLPGVKDVPILGTLFRSRDFQKAETELVVIVTPFLVRPTERHKLARPDDGLAPASDLKANFLGHINRVYGRGKEMPSGGLKGDYGFIVE
jgi:pilus assembly protein CpaC